MADAPTVSIITPTRNHARYLAAAMESVVSQAGSFHLDYIIKDGGSDDGSAPKIRELAERVNGGRYDVKCGSIRVRWSSGPDGGQAVAINQGLAMATGDVVAWLNSDDRYEPGAIKAALDVLGAHPSVGFVYGDCRYVTPEGQTVSTRSGPERFEWRRFVTGTQGLAQPTVFVRRRVAAEAGPLDARLFYTLDADWFLRIAQKTAGTYIPRVLASALLHDRAKTADRLAPDYCAERVLVNARYGGATAFATNFGTILADMVAETGASSEDAFAALSQAVERKAAQLEAHPFGPHLLAKARARASLLLALSVAADDRRAARGHLRAALAGSPSSVATLVGMQAAAKCFLPSRIYGLVGRMFGRGVRP